MLRMALGHGFWGEVMDRSELAGAVDVVIPMRDGAATIQRTLATVHAQTLQPHRIIIVDDGSTDAGAELVRDLPLVEVISTAARGVSHARNVGIGAARAEFIAFLDADDLWRSDKLERQMMVAQNHPEAALITCDLISVDPHGDRPRSPRSRIRYAGHVGEQILHDCLRMYGWSSSMLVRRSALIASGGYDEALNFFEDADICLRLVHGHALAFSPELLAFVVENPKSVTRRPRSLEQQLTVTLQVLSVLEKWIDRTSDPVSLERAASRAILYQFVQKSLNGRRLLAFRREVALRVPRLARRIARNDVQFFIKLGMTALRTIGPHLGRRLIRGYAMVGGWISWSSAVPPAPRFSEAVSYRPSKRQARQ